MFEGMRGYIGSAPDCNDGFLGSNPDIYYKYGQRQKIKTISQYGNFWHSEPLNPGADFLLMLNPGSGSA
jgi:hypothetical protein